MKKRLLHLYPDLMNLYGDCGNVWIVEKALRDSGVDVTVDRAAPGDELRFVDYDMVFLGPGTERSQRAALNALRPYREAVLDAIAREIPFLATGNAMELFGNSLTDETGETVPGLGAFDFETVQRGRDFTVTDVLATSPLFSETTVGFLNSCSTVTPVASPLFTLTFGDAPPTDGVYRDGFLGTRLIGPLLVRNPHILRLFVEKLTGRSYTPDPLQTAAYDTVLAELCKRQAAAR